MRNAAPPPVLFFFSRALVAAAAPKPATGQGRGPCPEFGDRRLLNNARVEVKDSSLFTLTDEGGFFRLAACGRHRTLRVLYTGSTSAMSP